MAFDHSLVTTALELPGYKVSKNFGIVRGIVVRSRSIFGSVGASLQQLVGGNITLYTELCEKVRMESYELMIQHAAQIGANGIISMRYDATEISPGVTEVLCYGTAVGLSAA
ncbi:MAG: YbjQ family protein [Candidatus Eremiobacteraeota bacterium]|nr:YbjQ family protein [Candidatus Eremiobacteraeota bacterium]MBV8366790.1 YbjQ family protein [Candidatus Eremiobacteraeota bacterium]